MAIGKESLLLCYSCGGPGLKKIDNGLYKCEFCGNTLRDKKDKEAEMPSQIVEQLNAADSARRLRHFDRALEIYDTVIAQDDKRLLAYWGAFLSEFGIEYVKEGGAYVPRIHLITRYTSEDSKYLKRIYELCSDLESADYRIKAAEIEQLRHRAYELSLTQKKYDVFICCGEKPSEEQAAKKLYDELTEEGFKVFVPSVSIPLGVVSAEACIFAASESASTMFVVADSIDTLEKNDYIWARFIADGGKKIQVLHGGLSESEFPSRLRKTFQRQAPINLNDIGWLKAAKDFASQKKEREEAPVQHSTQTVVTERVVVQGRKAESLSEAMTMLLSNLTVGSTDMARQIIYEQFAVLGAGELEPIANLCTELAILSKCPPPERQMHINTIQSVGGRIRNEYPTLTIQERSVYCNIKNADLLVYLAKCFGAIKDRARQCFVLDMIDYHNLYTTRTVTELVQMLLANDRLEEVSELMKKVRKLDGNALLLAYLKGFDGDSVQNQQNLLYMADKLENINPAAIEDSLNVWLSECEDVGVALAVVTIMNKNGIRLNALGLSGAISKITDADSAERVLKNFTTGLIKNIELDKLIELAANGGNEVAKVVLRYLRYNLGITDLGSYNMQFILDKCDIEKIKTEFFDFNIDKKLATDLLIGSIKGNGADRLATVSVLIGNVNNIDILTYEKMLLGGDPLKKEFMKLLAPKTGKYADANKTIEAFLTGRDSDEDKREIFEMFGDFPFSKRSKELYLDILPERYDETYIKYLYPYLEENPSEARRLFVKHYERLAEGYEKHLVKIFGYVRSYDESGICRFFTEFKGSQDVKDKIVPQITEFADKPKKIEAVCGNVQCNLLQAYLLTLKEWGAYTDATVNYLRKKGMDAGDKVFVGGRKLKFKDYLGSGDVRRNVCELIAAHVKL